MEPLGAEFADLFKEVDDFVDEIPPERIEAVLKRILESSGYEYTPPTNG